MKADLPPYKTIDEYISIFPPKIQKILQELRETIQKQAPTAKEKISYGIATFHLNHNLVHFAAYEKHIGFYPGPHAITVFKKDFAKYKTSKGAVQFPLTEKLPLSLIKKIVKFRVEEETNIL